MAALLGLMTVGALSAAALAMTLMTVVNGLLAVWQARILHEHRKGKRSVLGRLWGRVVVTVHGRLAVER